MMDTRLTRTIADKLAPHAFKIGIVLISFAVAGCATIISGGRQDLTFSSDPSGAIVVLDGQEVGRTPVTLTRKRRNDPLNVEMRLEGHETQRTTLDSGVNMFFLGNIILGGVIGTSTDYVSGALFEYKPNRYHAVLPEKDEQANEATYRNRLGLTKFVMLNYHHLAEDLALGRGEYLDALLGELNVAEDNRPAAIEKLRELRAEHREIPAFAEAVYAEMAAG